jgi:hypothetical protein
MNSPFVLMVFEVRVTAVEGGILHWHHYENLLFLNSHNFFKTHPDMTV